MRLAEVVLAVAVVGAGAWALARALVRPSTYEITTRRRSDDESEVLLTRGNSTFPVATFDPHDEVERDIAIAAAKRIAKDLER